MSQRQERLFDLGGEDCRTHYRLEKGGVKVGKLTYTPGIPFQKRVAKALFGRHPNGRYDLIECRGCVTRHVGHIDFNSADMTIKVDVSQDAWNEIERIEKLPRKTRKTNGGDDK